MSQEPTTTDQPEESGPISTAPPVARAIVIIGASALVNKPLPANSLAVGVPAKVIKQI